MINFLYNLGIRCFNLGFFVFSLFNLKAKKRKHGLLKAYPEHKNSYLFHCASAGEFEQAFPIIEKLKKAKPESSILISFYSASGPEWLKKKGINFPYVYLPNDTTFAMDFFIKTIQPQAVFIVKNEFWFNFFKAIQENEIPLFLFATAFKNNHFSLRYSYFKNILRKCDHIFLLDELSFKNSKEHLSNISLSGDPRIDRIIEESKSNKLPEYFGLELSKSVIIFASVHREDLAVINSIIQNKNYHYIIVPHEVDSKEIQFFQKNISVESSLYKESEKWDGEPIIIDAIGKLSKIYKISRIAYIGGGFGKGIHNILEAAIHGNMIYVGPNNHHFPESRLLKGNGAIIEFQNKSNFGLEIDSLNEREMIFRKEQMSLFFKAHKDSSNRIISTILRSI